ncbi:hypothetical protein BRC19_00530 [Candidatus Saccharibacteria bacterium QS_5_54_17]|nr:MAG: hypothetical protein BRC19_00530 [Candidatus Saccharibacteria bacterium QS_5_54_17]PSO43786.1 MAG: hypothetical protein BRC20_00010 [Candidatus Saccharibacteria bacterium QS_8_54_8]
MRSDDRWTDRSKQPVEGEVLEGMPAQKGRARNSNFRWKLLNRGNLRWIGLLLICLPAVIALGVVLSLGFWSEYILPVFSNTIVPAFGLSALILVALTFFEATRQRAARALHIGSWVYWLAIWMLGFLITMQYWGVFAVITGLILFGIGVIPLGVAAAILHTNGQALLHMVTLLLLAIGSRRLALQLKTSDQYRRKIWKYFSL